MNASSRRFPTCCLISVVEETNLKLRESRVTGHVEHCHFRTDSSYWVRMSCVGLDVVILCRTKKKLLIEATDDNTAMFFVPTRRCARIEEAVHCVCFRTAPRVWAQVPRKVYIKALKLT